MKEEFILERIEHQDVAGLLRCLTGWEAVVFVLEDVPPDEEASG
jgi:hypothetical protein